VFVLFKFSFFQASLIFSNEEEQSNLTLIPVFVPYVQVIQKKLLQDKHSSLFLCSISEEENIKSLPPVANITKQFFFVKKLSLAFVPGKSFQSSHIFMRD
jgi:hypothetical protein